VGGDDVMDLTYHEVSRAMRYWLYLTQPCIRSLVHSSMSRSPTFVRDPKIMSSP